MFHLNILACATNLMQLVLSTGTGVNGFTLDPSLGEFILTHPDIKVTFELQSFSCEIVQAIEY
jgi:fructose-1,6-bisphosphatase